jgi:hypothetical protein
MNRRSFLRTACAVALAAVALGLTACKVNYYNFPQYNYAGRAVPPSQLANRVMVAIANPSAFSGGQLEILDALRDQRFNVPDTITEFNISGYAGRVPTTIQSFPEQQIGYVYGSGDGSFTRVSYASESTAGTVGGIPSSTDSVATTSTGAQVYAASGAVGGVIVVDNTSGKSYDINLPGAQYVFPNTGNSVVLVTVRNVVDGPASGTQTTFNLYRIVKLNNNVLPPAGTYADCEPVNLPVYCAVPVKGIYDRPVSVVYSLDGSQAYVLNCGPECGGTTAGVSFLNTATLNVNYIPTGSDPSPVASTVAVPGGATVGLTDGTYLYVAGQYLLTSGAAKGYYTGKFSIITLGATPVVNSSFPVPDGTHTKMLFADNNTLWIGSTYCTGGANGYLASYVSPYSSTPGSINLNCLAVYQLGSGQTPTVVPQVTSTTPVPYPNTNNNQYYYGDLTGICWVQNLNKVYSAYGGQVHAFSTIAPYTEINNQYITVQGTAENVVYMDALTNDAN